jgi:hypothetical protein
MMNCCLLMALPLFPVLAYAGPLDAKPVSVRIVSVPAERRDYGEPVGNVRVRYRDGHAETWTSGGRYLMPKVSPGGLVGWCRFSMRNSYDDPMNSTVRVRFLDGRVRDFPAHERPFITRWAFADHDTALVIESMGRHGPCLYIKYRLRTGEVLGTVDISAPGDQLPPWTRAVTGYRPGP